MQYRVGIDRLRGAGFKLIQTTQDFHLPSLRCVCVRRTVQTRLDAQESLALMSNFRRSLFAKLYHNAPSVFGGVPMGTEAKCRPN
jgi:hypothetical protein